MSYNSLLDDFKKAWKLEEVDNKKVNERISWCLSKENPFGLYFAAKELRKKSDQRSKDEAIRYYKDFVKHTDIVEEGAEVKKAIKTVLYDYRNGYGTKTEQYEAIEAFQQAITSKGFTVPKVEKRPTQSGGTKEQKKWNWIHAAVSVAGPLAVTGALAGGKKVWKLIKPTPKKVSTIAKVAQVFFKK